MNHELNTRSEGLFSQIFDLTQAMLLYANDEEWEKFETLEDERKRLLTCLFSESVKPEHAALYASKINHLLDMNNELEKQAAKGKKKVKDELQGLRNAENLKKSYGQTSNFGRQ